MLEKFCTTKNYKLYNLLKFYTTGKTICKISMIFCTTENANCTTEKHKLESGTKIL